MARLLLTVFLFVIFSGANGQFKLYEKGHSSYKDGKYTEAISYLSDYLTKSMRDKSIDADVFYIRALSYYKTKDYKNSIPDFEETLLRGHANKGNIYWFLGKSHYELSELDESLNSYNNAIRELSGNHEAKGKLLYERSLVFSRKGDLLMASADIQNAFALQPENPEIKQEYEKLKGSFQASRQTSEPGAAPKKQNNNGTQQNTSVTPVKNDSAEFHCYSAS
jgi:tetratricopeptide (TPR) repeat protein